VVKGHIATVALGIAVLATTTAMAQQSSPAEVEQVRARRLIEIANMENALKLAVRTGASNLAGKLQRVPGDIGMFVNTMLMSDPDAQGMRIPSFGVVFNVRVPGMRSNFLWAQSVLATQTGPRQLKAQVVGQSQAPPASPVDAGVLTDPDAEYRLAVKNALIDAMLLDSAGLNLGVDEFLAVGARRDKPVNPLDPSDSVRTVTFTVKGSVPEAVRSKRISLEEARKLVVVDGD
jgi:hypothetical protein